MKRSPTIRRQALTIAGRDLRIEGRSREVALVVLPFAAAAVFVVPLATDAVGSRLDGLANPVFWLVGLVFGMQVALRQTGTETRTQRRQLALLGVDPVARFAGRSGAAALLLTGVLAVLAPLTVLFYDPPPIPNWWVALAMIPAFALGMAMLATLAGDVTTGLRLRTALAPLLVVPVAVPLLMGASQTVEALLQGRSILPWVLVIVLTDLLLAITGTIVARPLEESAR